MKHLANSLIALALATTAVQGQAQDAGQAPPEPNPGAAAQPDTGPPPSTPAPSTDAVPASGAPAPDAAPPSAAAASDAGATAKVSDIEVDSFAKATIAVQKISADAKLADTDKQKKMADAVKSSGLDPLRYNEIGKAIATDTALRAKVQTAMAKYAGPGQG